MSEMEAGDLDGEGWGKWDGVPLPQWIRSRMAPYTAAVRERHLQELLDALNRRALEPPPVLGNIEGNGASQSQPCGLEEEPLPPRVGCLLCKGADDDENFDYCRACDRVADPLPYGARYAP